MTVNTLAKREESWQGFDDACAGLPAASDSESYQRAWRLERATMRYQVRRYSQWAETCRGQGPAELQTDEELLQVAARDFGADPEEFRDYNAQTRGS